MRFSATLGRAAARVCLSCAVVLLLSGGVGVAGQTGGPDESRPVEVTLRPDRETFALDEPTYLSFEIKNFSARRMCVGLGGDYRNNLGRPNSFRVVVRRDDGRAVPQPEVKFEGGGLYGCSPVPAEGSHVVRLFLPHWATFEEPGTYTVNVKRRLPLFVTGRKSSETFPKPDFVLDADVSATVVVVAGDANKTGELIDRLGRAMLDFSDPDAAVEASAALAHIEDKRTVAYFARALEKYGQFEFHTGWEESRIASNAAAALGDYADDAALAALEAAAHSPSEDTRHRVAYALAGHKHRRAFEVLSRMQNDPSEAVRRWVVYGVAKSETEESLALLRKLAQDENEDVRKAARAALDKRAEK